MPPPHRPQRPLSPHIQIYKMQLTSVLSITHRLTGLLLFKAALLWSLYLVVWPSGQGVCLMEWVVLKVALTVFLGAAIFSLFYHLLNGIRHLVWDCGKGFDLNQVYASGWAVVAAACVLTGGTLWALL
jgi:succinate dehydrogenase / fumarate reductase cytochrome b subunit